MGYHPAVNTKRIHALTDHFTQVARHNGFAIGTPSDYNESLLKHQVPGGMISNLRFQLENVGKGHLMQEVLEETAQVRADLGYPIMVTPYSQFVGVQAVMNVLVGERYKQVTDQVLEYALGHWGEEEASGIDPDVKDRLVNQPRAKELARWEPPETTVAELRQSLGGTEISDDELLLRYFAGEDDVATMRRLGPRDSGALDTYQPITTLIDELAKRPDIRHFYVQRGNFTAHLEKAAE
jgi:oxaloacetate decarboxylase alpha subunit